ncbi:MAG: hypothetical protein ABIB04_03030 [Patescibacteria group bacterium]
MSENPFDIFRPPAEKPEAIPEKPKNLVTYRQGEQGEVTVDLNNLTPEDLQVLSDAILDHEPDSLLGMQAKLHNAIVEAKNAKGDRKKELEEYVVRAKEDLDLELEVEGFDLGKLCYMKIKNCDRGFIEKVGLRKSKFARLQNILPRIAPFLIVNTSLDFLGSSLYVDDIHALADSPILRQLTCLDLGGVHMGSKGARALADSPNLRQLTSLDLANNSLGPKGARALADSPYLRRLASLNLYGNVIGPEGTRVLVNSPNLLQLTNLDLSSNNIGPKGAQALANSPNLRQLTSLNLDSNDVGLEGVRALAASPNLRQLTHLGLFSNELDPKGLHVLAETKNFPNLKNIDLRVNRFNLNDSYLLADINALKARGVEVIV